MLVVAWVHELWNANFRIPLLRSDGDGLAALAGIKGIVETGWVFTNPSLGVPYGQQQYDYAAQGGDALQDLGLRALAFFTSDPALIINVYYLLGYAAVTVAAYWVLRVLGIGRPTSAVCALLFSVLPYHFFRGQQHLFLGAYFAVPAGAWLFLQVVRGKPIIAARDDHSGALKWGSWLSLGTLAAVLVVGASTLYYAVFTMLLLGLAGLLRLAGTRNWRSAIAGLAAAVAIAVVVVVSISPGLVYQAQHGKNTVVAKRLPTESELYALTLTQLVRPDSAHRVPLLGRAGQRYQNATVIGGEGGMQLGFLLAISLTGLVGLLAVSALAKGRANSTPSGELGRAAAIGAGACLLIGMVGGISALIAFYVSPQIRGWGRIVPFIAFFALVGLALVIEALRQRLLKRKRGALLAGAVLAVVAVIGVLDQTRPLVPPYKAFEDKWNVDSRFVADIERIAPPDGTILQLPFYGYPESPPLNEMADYDLFVGYVHSKGLGWSYGSMKGRPQDWSDEAVTQPVRWVVQAAVAAGFDGVYVDRFAYKDRGRAVERAIDRALNLSRPNVVSADGRRAYYDASALTQLERSRLSAQQQSELADALVKPVSITFMPAVTPGNLEWQWSGMTASVVLDNPTDRARTVEISGVVSGPAQVLRIEPPGGTTRMVRIGPLERRVNMTAVAAPGKSEVRITVEGTPSSQPIRFFNLRIVNHTPLALKGH